MREQGEGGRIIVVGSPAGQLGNFGQTNYAAAKAGIAAFARTWAMELARAKVTVNAVIPTAWTAMTESIPAFAPLAELLAAGKPLPRGVRRDHGIGMPEECAPLVVFLASDAAAGDDRPVHRARRRPPRAVVAPGRGRDAVPATAAGAPSRSRQAWEEQLADARQPYGMQFGELDLGA